MRFSCRVVLDETPHRKAPDDAQRKGQNVAGDFKWEALLFKHFAPNFFDQKTGSARRSPNDPAQIRFGLSKPGVSTVLVGYSNLGQLEEAIKYAERGALADDAVQRVLEL